jgi:hypothetical protein
MSEHETDLEVERPSEFWRRVYIAVIAVTFLVITALWAFSKYFS